MTPMNKYKKFLEEKISSGNTEGINYFNPNSILKNSKSKKILARVLPRGKGELFFFQFKKHSYKVGTAFKNNFCMYSLDSSGETVGSTCPFCDFLKENKEIIDKKIYTKLSSKDAYIMAVYNYSDDEIQKYEVNYYGITDILTTLQKLDEDFDPDLEGFDLVFEKDENGFAKVTHAIPPEVTIEEIKKSSKNFSEATVDVEKEVIPKFKDKYLKTLKASFDYALKAFLPTFTNSSEQSDEREETRSKKRSFDPNEEDEEIEEETFNESKKTKIAIDAKDDEEDDEEIEDIKNFLKNRKK